MNKKQARQAAKAGKAAAVKPVEQAAVPEVAPKAAKPAKQSKVVASGAMPKLPPLPKASRSRKPKPFVKCKCGCEGDTRGEWVPGHDARARGWAIRIERGITTMAGVPENERPGAKHFLKVRKETGVADAGSNGIKLVKGKKGDAAPETASLIPDEATSNPAVGE